MDLDAIVGDRSDATLYELQRYVRHRLGADWFRLASSDQETWFDSAITRSALLAGEESPLWVAGDEDASQLVAVFRSTLVLARAPSEDQSEALVRAWPLRAIRGIELGGGRSAFVRYRDHTPWPGRLRIELRLPDEAVAFEVEAEGVRDFLGDTWDALRTAAGMFPPGGTGELVS